jgi:hypothetical protein
VPKTLQLASLVVHGSGKLDVTDNILVAPGTPTDARNLINMTHQVTTSAAGLFLGYGDAGGGNFKIRATILGDTDLNGNVNVADLGNLATNFNRTDASWINGDFDYNGNVNVADLGDLATNFNNTLPGSGSSTSVATTSAVPAAVAAATAVPEPASIALIALGGGAVFIRGRRRHTRSHLD